MWAAQQALGRTAAAVQVGFFAFALQGGWGFLVHITRNWTPGTQLKVPAVCFGRLNTVHGGVCKTACAFGTGRISGMLYCVRAFGGLVVALSFGFLCTFCSDPGFILVFVFVLSMWTLKLGKEVCNVCGFGFGLDHL